MTISRYLMWQVARLFGAVLAVLAVLFAGYCAAGVLADAVNGLLPTAKIAEIVALKVLISLEVLIPISLLMAVLLAFGRLYGDSEMTAMFALKVAPLRVAGAVLAVSGSLAVCVGALSLLGRPFAYQKLHLLSQRAQALLNVDAMQAGTFYSSAGGKRVIFIGRRDGRGAAVRDVFIQLAYPDHTEIIHADAAFKLAPGGGEIDLRDAHIYKIGDTAGYSDEVVDAADLFVNPDLTPAGTGKYGIAEMSSARLAASGAPKEVAEWQWRLSTPVSTLLLGMLGLPLGKVRPRQSRFARFGTAILIYGLYYLLCMSARTWVAQGAIGRFPGLWWAPALLALTLAFVALRPRWNFGPRRRAAA